ncbi:hypothetical protein AVEN_93699-1 [Araneus ventricosus]|uniref:Uncharacterized protein n=1 Tax=Araneus ventricosus TaxID=182803 RepID=A0A4Y2JES7_ARAVE|nr:hypothetical protein AVEN_93699-1 [Araneus ventricosus]
MFICQSVYSCGTAVASGEVSAYGPEGPMFKTRFYKIRLARCQLDLTSRVRWCWCRVEVWRWGASCDCCSCHLTTAQNYKVRPKIPFVLLEKWTLMLLRTTTVYSLACERNNSKAQGK